MLHPILKNRQFLIGYIIIWFVVCALHVFILGYLYDFGIVISVSESFVFNLFFAFFGIGIWYPVYFTDIEKNKLLNFLTNHLAAASLAVGLWLWISFLILSAAFPDASEYLQHLSDSLPLRGGLGVLFYVLVASIYYFLIYYNNFKEKLIREAELKALIKESELTSLKFQINPHFLFNSLNSISSLSMISPEKAQDMVINLSDFLRYSLSHKNESLTTFEKELNNIDRYLKIEKIRFGKRLNVTRDITDNCNTYLLPGLILQPLMENAVKYGIYESTDQSDIYIKSKCSDNLLEVMIKNDYDPDFVTKKGEGIGLRNVTSRMKIQYGRDDLVKISQNENTFTITLFFPQDV
ncbi:MAG: histidine kinase [Bacteroidales bacterium]|nr:histidine kinase [Bacteroidales bacterium]